MEWEGEMSEKEGPPLYCLTQGTSGLFGKGTSSWYRDRQGSVTAQVTRPVGVQSDLDVRNSSPEQRVCLPDKVTVVGMADLTRRQLSIRRIDTWTLQGFDNAFVESLGGQVAKLFLKGCCREQASEP